MCDTMISICMQIESEKCVTSQKIATRDERSVDQ